MIGGIGSKGWWKRSGGGGGISGGAGVRVGGDVM